MATDVYINIKDLPELTEINNGDYIVVETSTGTHIINFQNFLLPSANTVIATTVTQNASSFSSSITSLSSSVNLLSSSLISLSTSPIKGEAQMTIKSGDFTSSKVITSRSDLTAANIFLTPTSQYAAATPAYVDSVDTTGMITIRTSSASALTSDATYNVLIIKT